MDIVIDNYSISILVQGINWIILIVMQLIYT